MSILCDLSLLCHKAESVSAEPSDGMTLPCEEPDVSLSEGWMIFFAG